MGEERTPFKRVALTFLMKKFSFQLVVFKSITPKFVDLEEKQGEKNFSLFSAFMTVFFFSPLLAFERAEEIRSLAPEMTGLTWKPSLAFKDSSGGDMFSPPLRKL